MSYLKLDRLHKRYGDTTVVDDFTLEIEEGELVSLLGPSGCGKTTTLMMVAGFSEPTGGRIMLEGRDITSLRPDKRGMGIMFQSYALFPHMTVAKNISFGLEMQGMPAAQRAERIRETMALVQLDGLEDRYPAKLSGGQRQRVAIARALAIRPKVLLLDEPMSNLDAKLREEMHVELRHIQKILNITTILVTHDQVEAMTMSDRIAVMHSGRIVQLSTPFDAYEQPHTAFASEFLGKTNRIQGRVQQRNERCCIIQVGEQTLKIPHHDRACPDDAQIYLRPEKIQVLPHGQGRTAGTVRTRLFLGSHWLLAVDTDLGALRITVANLGAPPPDTGGHIGLDWNDDDMRLLTPELSHG